MRTRRFLYAMAIWLVWASTAAADPRCAAVATGGNVGLITVGGQPYCVHQFTTVGQGILPYSGTAQSLILLLLAVVVLAPAEAVPVAFSKVPQYGRRGHIR